MSRKDLLDEIGELLDELSSQDLEELYDIIEDEFFEEDSEE